MRILHIMPVLGVGGASRLMTEIIPQMNAYDGIEVDFLIGKFLDKTFLPVFEKAGVKMYVLGCKSLYSPKNIIKIRKYTDGYDLVHVHLFPSLYWVSLSGISSSIPLIYTEHNTTNHRRNKRYLQPIEKWVYGRYKRIISISESTESALKKWLNAKKDDKRFIVVNNGVNLEDFNNCKQNKIYPHTLIMVARFAPAKDQATIIRAMNLLGEDVHLILVGNGEKMGDCKALAKELNVDERVHFVGTQSDVPSWIGKADIGIQSSHWEGFGLTAVEMMAGGLPVVASDVEGVKQIVEGAGVLFPHGDYKKLAEIVKKLLSNKNYYESVKQQCINRSQVYDIKTMVERYINVYKEILECKN